MNKIILIGRIVANPDIYTTSQDVKYSRLKIAITRKFSRDKTDFIPLIAWNKNAEFIEKYIDKGSHVSIEGSLQSSSYMSKEGINITKYEVNIESINFLESKAQAEERRQSNNFNSNEGFNMDRSNNFTSKNKPQNDDYNIDNQSNSKNQSQSNTLEDKSNDDDIPWDLDF